MSQGYTKGIPIDTDSYLTANSEFIVPSQSAVKTFLDRTGVAAVSTATNNAFSQANAAFDKANSANVLAFNTGIGANNYAGFMANSINVYVSATYATLGNLTTAVEYAGVMANSANGYAETIVSANLVTAREYTNTSTSSANNYAGAMANSANAYTVTVGTAGNTYAAAVGTSANAWASATFATITNAAAAFAYANGVGTNAAAAFASANTVGGYANTVGGYANTAGAAANQAGVIANSAFGSANTAGSQANQAGVIANAAFAAANQAGTVANNANTYANTTYVKKAGDTISGDLVVQGNLTTSGVVTYANTQTLLIGDALITLNADLPAAVAPSEDAGIEVKRGSSANVSLLWNEAGDTWTFTNDGISWLSIASNVDVGSANNYAGAMANSVNSAFATADSGVRAYVNTSVGAANNYAGAMANSANAVASATYATITTVATNATSANNYAGAMANAANAYAATVGTSSNAWASATFATITNAAAAFAFANGVATNTSAAFSKANNALANTSGVSFAGNLFFPVGNVGVGQASATYRLDVKGQTRIGYDVTPASPDATNIISTAHTILGGNGANYLTIGQYGAANTYAQWIQSSFANTQLATYNLVLQPAGGNIGIGTATPTFKIDTTGPNLGATVGSQSQMLRLTANDGNADYLEITHTRTNTTASWIGAGPRLQQKVDTTWMGYIQFGGNDTATNPGGISIGTGLRSLPNSVPEVVRIDPSGNVGIGTTSPTYKLHVIGSFAANTKSFVIDHPIKSGMKLRYGSLEGPENGVYVRGKILGKVIELPDYWTGLVDEDSITVQLTGIGSSQNLYVVDIRNNKVYINSENDITPYCFYYIQAERKDVEKLVVEFDV